MKKSRVIVLLLLVVFLTGCLKPQINVKIVPNPIELTAEGLLESDFLISGVKLKFRTSGFSADYKIEDVRIVVYEAEEEEPLLTKTVEIDKSTPIIPGQDFEEDVPDICLKELFDLDMDEELDLLEHLGDEQYEELFRERFLTYYEEEWKDHSFWIEVHVGGTNPTSNEAEVKFL